MPAMDSNVVKIVIVILAIIYSLLFIFSIVR